MEKTFFLQQSSALTILILSSFLFAFIGIFTLENIGIFKLFNSRAKNWNFVINNKSCSFSVRCVDFIWACICSDLRRHRSCNRLCIRNSLSNDCINFLGKKYERPSLKVLLLPNIFFIKLVKNYLNL